MWGLGVSSQAATVLRLLCLRRSPGKLRKDVFPRCLRIRPHIHVFHCCSWISFVSAACGIGVRGIPGKAAGGISACYACSTQNVHSCYACAELEMYTAAMLAKPSGSHFRQKNGTIFLCLRVLSRIRDKTGYLEKSIISKMERKALELKGFRSKNSR